MYLTILFSHLLLLATSHLANEATPPSLFVNVQNVEVGQGWLYLAIYHHAGHFLSEEDMTRAVVVPVLHKGGQVVTIEGLPFGEYAISVFHDENGNQRLDTGLFRIPKEPYGFSNDAKGRFGPPSFEAAKFAFKETGKELTIHLR